MHEPRLRIGSKVRRWRRLGGYLSAFVKPQGRFWKRQAAKAARRADLTSGNAYRRAFGWFDWS